MDELILKVDNVSKQYVLGQTGETTLREELQRLSARLHRREEPNMLIGDGNYKIGDKFPALDGVSFEVKKGERIGIIGHNGAGKSTLLKLISRITVPTDGEIGLNGRVASILEVGTGFHEELTGRENIYMNGAILGMTKKEITDKLEDIIDFSECRRFIDTPIKRYSSGMCVKLAFSVTAHLDCEIMIMDEVLAVGDMAFQKKCLDKMNDVSKTEGRTILYVSHNMNTIRQLCERVIVLDHGKVVHDGGVEEGIAIYLGANGNADTCMHFDENHERISVDNSPCVLKRLEAVGADHMIFEREEIIKLRLYYQIFRPVKDLFFRFEILTSSGQLVGTAFSEESVQLHADEQYVIIDFDTKHLAPGKFISYVVAFQKDDLGNEVLIDAVYPGFLFEIIDSGHNKNLVWLSQYWGPAELHALNIYVE